MLSPNSPVKKAGFLLLIVFCLVGLGVYAQDEFNAPPRATPKITEYERAVFSFFKLAKSAPDYPVWVRNSQVYKKARTKSEQEKIYEDENLRLKWGYSMHNVDEHLLTVKTDVLLQMLIDKKFGPTLSFKFRNKQAILGTDDHGFEIPLFPYPYGRDWIALIINDLQKFVTVPLEKDQYQKAQAFFEPKKVYEGKLEMHVKPRRADNTEPIVIEDITQWLMIGETGFFKLTYQDPATGEEIVLWKYSAPWNIPVEDDLLNQLYIE